MKNLRTMVCLMGLLAGNFNAVAQVIVVNEPDRNRPKLFQQLPDKIPADLQTINELLKAETGASVNTDVSKTFSFRIEGMVISAATRQNNQSRSVVIRSMNFPGATMTVSLLKYPDGSVKYTGRILSFKHADVYVLQTKDGIMNWVKKDFYELINE